MSEERMMTQSELAEKYDVPMCEISLMLALSQVEPEGKMRRRNRLLKQYDEKKAAQAMIDRYKDRAERGRRIMERWIGEARRIKKIYMESKRKEGGECRQQGSGSAGC